jgi:hypothetical protein
MAQPLTTTEKQRIRDMLDVNCSHNEIARIMGRSQSTISTYAKNAGYSPLPDRTPTVANQARKDYAKAERLALISLREGREVSSNIPRFHEGRGVAEQARSERAGVQRGRHRYCDRSGQSSARRGSTQLRPRDAGWGSRCKAAQPPRRVRPSRCTPARRRVAHTRDGRRA